MIRLTGPRCLAMSVVGALFGWWVSLDGPTTMAHYRALSHDALLAELAERNAGVVSINIMSGVILVVGVVVVTDTLTRFFDAVWARIEPPPRNGGDGTPPGRLS